MARYKGVLRPSIEGVAALENLRDGDTVLISEGCTHHRQCDDIGTRKIPRWLKEHTGRDLAVATTSGTEFSTISRPTPPSSTAAAVCSTSGRCCTA